MMYAHNDESHDVLAGNVTIKRVYIHPHEVGEEVNIDCNNVGWLSQANELRLTMSLITPDGKGRASILNDWHDFSEMLDSCPVTELTGKEFAIAISRARYQQRLDEAKSGQYSCLILKSDDFIFFPAHHRFYGGKQ
ncbi:hypothetical protein [Scandinavium manionii]|uniref:hypothetical protein n=1 Tax=Scandinavium manionii TaxID=2926520 RepID=UPI00216609A6|nr:hypothetical protein [Scandinavium manionii]MCS2146804.1 hypothetical protein [Scandinavium manionii]